MVPVHLPLRPLLLSALLLALGGTVMGQPGTPKVYESRNGTAGSLEVPYAAPHFAPSALTIESWVTYDGSSLGSLNRFPTVARAGLSTGWSWFLRINAGSTNQRVLRFAVRTLSSGVLTLDHPFRPGEWTDWTHLAASYDGATMTLFVDGRAVASRPGAGALADNGGSLGIGEGRRDPNFHNEVWNGRLARTRLWSRALPEAELQAYLFFPLGPAGGLEGEWPMQGTGTDTSGFGRDGSIFGSLSWPTDDPPGQVLYATNSSEAELTLDGRLDSPFRVAEVQLARGARVDLVLDGPGVGQGFDLAYTLGRGPIAGGSGALGTPAGQWIGLDVAAAVPAFAYGGTLSAPLGSLWAAPQTLTIASTLPLQAAAQMVVGDPTLPGGLRLSAPVSLIVP